MSYAEDRGSGGNTLVIVLCVIGGILVVGLVVCGGLGYMLVRNMQPMMQKMEEMTEDVVKGQQTAEAFLSDLRDKRWDDAYQMTSAEYQKKISREDFEKLLRKHPEIAESGPIEKEQLQPRFEGQQPRGFEALRDQRYIYRFEGKSGSCEVHFRISRTDKDFKVNNLRFLVSETGSNEGTGHGTARSTGRSTAKHATGKDDDDDG
jgi:hypothetical protein